MGQCRCAPVAVCPGGGSGLFGSHSGPLAPLRKGLQELLWGPPPRYLLHLRQPQLVLGQGLQRQLCPLSLEEVACGRVLACGQHTGGAQDCPAGLSCVLAQPCPSRAARVLACPFRNPRILGVQSAALGLQKPVLMPGRAQTREPHASCLSSAAELLRSLVQRWPPAYAACSALAGEGLAVDILHIPQAPWGGGSFPPALGMRWG